MSLVQSIPGKIVQQFKQKTAIIRKQPDFLIIGAQRCGTTSLFNYLCDHPNIVLTSKKEIHFYDRNYERGGYWYRQFFPTAIYLSYLNKVRKFKMLCGDATPMYLFHPLVPYRVSVMQPDIKLIVLLRNPIERAYSHYWHEMRSDVHPGYPLLSPVRFWPNTITAFPEFKLDELPQILSISEKRFLKLGVDGLGGSWRFRDKLLKIAAVYVLTGIADQTVEIKAQSKAKGLITLSGNVYPEYSLNKSDMIRDFNFLSKFAACVPVRELYRTKGLQGLSVYRDAIINDFRSLF